MDHPDYQVRSYEMKQKVILTKRYQQEAIQQLQEDFDLIIVEGSGKSLQETLKQHPDTKALISFLSDKIDRCVMDLGQNLKIIANYAVGYNNIDVSYAKEKNIPVTNTPEVLTDATADFTMLLLLAVSRRLVQADAFTRAGKFKGWGANLMLGKHINGAAMGIVGMGRIGTATALRAKSFGMKILYYSRSRKTQLEEQEGFNYKSFNDLLKEADVVSLHLPSTPETYHLMNATAIDGMKKDAIFINVSRGDLMDEAYLAQKLEKRELFGAGLDVFEYEPKVTGTLIGLDNVVLAPHLGSATYTTRLAMAQITVANVKSVLSGQPPTNLVKEFLHI
jgi:glyoxylate reductase